MGYNSNLSKKQNGTLNPPSDRHILWKIGSVLRILGIIILAPIVIMIISAGGWGIFFIGNPMFFIGLLLLTFGHYFASNWKGK